MKNEGDEPTPETIRASRRSRVLVRDQRKRARSTGAVFDCAVLVLVLVGLGYVFDTSADVIVAMLVGLTWLEVRGFRRELKDLEQELAERDTWVGQ